MTDKGTDFLIFLKAYYSEDYAKLSSDNTPDDLVTAVISKHRAKFDIWLKVPERIRDEYHGRVPDDILEKAKRDSNLTLDECREIENNRTLPDLAGFIDNYDDKTLAFTPEETKSCKQLAKSFITDKGYDTSTAYIFAVGTIASRKLDNIRTSEDTPEFLKQAATKTKHMLLEFGIKLGRKSQKKHRPELALLTIARNLVAKKIDQDMALPQMDVLMKKIKENGRETELLEAIKSPRYKTLNDDTRLLFESLMQSYDIGNMAHNLEKVRNKANKKRKNNKETPKLPVADKPIKKHVIQPNSNEQINER